MEKLFAILKDPENAHRLAAELECDPPHLPDGYRSPLVGDPAGIQWYHVRKLLSVYAWDIYAGAAIKHYHTMNPGHAPPLLNAKGLALFEMPPQFVDALEEEYFRCKEVPWRDERPAGYSFDPFDRPWSTPTYRDSQTAHRELSSDMESLLNNVLVAIAPVVEATLGHFWAAGAVRLYSHRPGTDGGKHTDQWPLSIKKLMIYPTGAGPEIGSTTFLNGDGTATMLNGALGTWSIFENSTIEHWATAPKPGNKPRPTIEIAVMPAFRTDPKIKGHGINVGYPWFPPDIDGLESPETLNGFTTGEIKGRSLIRALLLALALPANLQCQPPYSGLGFYDS